MKSNFYDIESLTNVFTLANMIDDDTVELYYLCDDKSLICPDFPKAVTDRVHKNNRNFSGSVILYDLTNPESNYRLAKTFGLSDASQMNNPNTKSSYSDAYRLVCDTDTDYDEEEYPYFFGYNSFNYDTTMLTWYLYNTIAADTGKCYIQSAQSMRYFNDELFTPEFKERMPDRLRYAYKDPARPSLGYTQADYRLPTAVIRKNMIMSGRHIDVAKLNEKQSKVGLKRILGMRGYQILESNKLRPGQNTIENTDQLLDLFAYNVSDVVNLKKLFSHKLYQSNFMLKRQLLKDYPDIIYKEKDKTYKPDISPYTVRNDRLFIDSSSAQLATKALCPYGHLSDYDTVSFMYPSKAKADAMGIKQINVLEEAKKFFYSKFDQPEVRAQFDAIYNYYKSIEGRNFNTSKNYLEDHNIDPDAYNPEDLLPEGLRPIKFNDLEVPQTCLCYFNKDGSPSSCFVNFSVGGIHGAEYNKRLWEYDLEQYKDVQDQWVKKTALWDKVKAIYPDPCDLKKNKGVVIDGVKYKPSDFLKPKATPEKAYYKDPPKPPKAPVLFKKTKTPSGTVTWQLESRYAYTSAAMTNHEDFTSYYPNLLRMMDAFFNPGLGYDRYGEIFDNKTKFGKLMKDKSLEAAVRERYSVMREGTKLVLNSASGAADANFESNIRMNNKIISMRIIGQMFTWRIGQAQTIEGAKMISTNTDGLYSVLEAEFNNQILKRESESINVEIEPEPIFLISKDTNNRAEIEIKDGQLANVANASGGTLACRQGPNPAKALAHPAILDWALTEYLTIASIGYKGLSLEKPFDNTIGMSILKSARKLFDDDLQTMLMFQNIIASSPGSQRFTFATTDDSDSIIPLQHYNRCFIVKDKTPGSYHLQSAVAKAITDVTQKKRKKDNERAQQHDPVAVEILAINGIKASSLPINKEATVVKITGIEERWYMRIDNSDLHMKSQEEIDELFNELDYDKYLELFRNSFENNWRNITPEWEQLQKAKAAKENTSAPCDLFDNDTENQKSPEPSSIESETSETQLTESCETQNPITEPAEKESVSIPDPVPISTEPPETDMPRMIRIQKTLLDTNDIHKGEHHLCMNGIREIDAHTVLAKLLKIMMDTDIDT